MKEGSGLMPWVSAYTVVLVVSLGALGLLVGRMRGESWAVIALNTVGAILFFFGLAWSTTLEPQAFGAVAVATLGAILFTMGSERSRVARRNR